MSDQPNNSDLDRREYLRVAGLLGTAGMAGLAGCSGGGGSEGTSGGNGGSGGSGQALEVLHAWTGGDGAEAIDALTTLFEKKHPDMKTDFRPIGGGGNTNLNTVVSKRLGNNNPPSSFAGWPGANLIQYEGVLGDIGGVWEEFKDQHVQEAVEASKFNEKFVAVPIGSHRLNDLFYNVKVVEQAGVNPKDITDFQGLVDALKKVQNNTDAVPMAHAMKLPWPTLQLFGVTMLSTQGYQPYMDFTKGKGDKQKVMAALRRTKTILKNYINDDASSIGFTSANQMIMNGKAAFIHQGNWVAGAYKGQQGFEYGKDWNAVTFPGTQGMYTLHMDSFIYPKPNPTPEKTKTWMSFVGSKEAQMTFNTLKGSIPTRKDTNAAEFGPYLKKTIEEFKSAKQKPPTLAHGLAVPPRTLSNLKGAINNNFTGPYNVEATADAMLQAIKDGQA